MGTPQLLGYCLPSATTNISGSRKPVRPFPRKSLPWFLADLRPDGFTGRAFVRRLHEDLALPPRVLDWHNDHVLAALSRRGKDTLGGLVVGQESLDPWTGISA